MRTNLSKFVVLVLVASAILALAGCEAFNSVAPKTQQETVPERAFDLNISVTTVGPVKYIDTLSAPEGSVMRTYLPMLNPGDQAVFGLKVKLARFAEGEKIFAQLIVKAKDADFVVTDIPLTLIWSAQELTPPVRPADNERDARVWERYNDAVANFPPTKTVNLFLPSHDIAVASLLKSISTEINENEDKYKVNPLDLAAANYPTDNIYVDDLDKLFNKFLYFDLQEMKSPDVTTKLIDTWSGKGNFTTPVFTVNYDRIKITATVKTAGRFQYYLYDVNGAKLSGSEMTYQPDKPYLGSMSVKPGESYYIEITAPADMQWTFMLEETNSPP